MYQQTKPGLMQQPIQIHLKRKTLNGKIVFWDNNDPGTKKYKGSVYFENLNYQGFLCHDGTVELKNNNRFQGYYSPIKA